MAGGKLLVGWLMRMVSLFEGKCPERGAVAVFADDEGMGALLPAHDLWRYGNGSMQTGPKASAEQRLQAALSVLRFMLDDDELAVLLHEAFAAEMLGTPAAEPMRCITERDVFEWLAEVVKPYLRAEEDSAGSNGRAKQ